MLSLIWTNTALRATRPYVIWGYAHNRSNTEDRWHIQMDVEAIDSLLSINPALLSEVFNQREVHTGRNPSKRSPLGKEPRSPADRSLKARLIGRFPDDKAFQAMPSPSAETTKPAIRRYIASS